MTEEEKLKNRLENMNGNIHIDKGEKWNDLTREERAKAINDVLDNLDNAKELNFQDSYF